MAAGAGTEEQTTPWDGRNDSASSALGDLADRSSGFTAATLAGSSAGTTIADVVPGGVARDLAGGAVASPRPPSETDKRCGSIPDALFAPEPPPPPPDKDDRCTVAEDDVAPSRLAAAAAESAAMALDTRGPAVVVVVMEGIEGAGEGFTAVTDEERREAGDGALTEADPPEEEAAEVGLEPEDTGCRCGPVTEDEERSCSNTQWWDDNTQVWNGNT